MIGSQLWWNWEVDTTRYFGWQQLIREFSARHIKVMTYCNPCLAQVLIRYPPNSTVIMFSENLISENLIFLKTEGFVLDVDMPMFVGSNVYKALSEVIGSRLRFSCVNLLWQVDEKPNSRRNLFEEAKELDILIKDKKGKPYMVPNTAFDVGMLDLTHPRTARWFKQILQEMVDDGVRGWMADFGEGLPVDALLYSGLLYETPFLRVQVFTYQKTSELAYTHGKLGVWLSRHLQFSSFKCVHRPSGRCVSLTCR